MEGQTEFLSLTLDQWQIFGIAFGIFVTVVAGNVGLYRLINHFDRQKIKHLQTELANEKSHHETAKKQRESYKAELKSARSDIADLENQLAEEKTGVVEAFPDLEGLDEVEKELVWQLAGSASASVGLIPLKLNSRRSGVEVDAALRRCETKGWVVPTKGGYALTPPAAECLSRILKSERDAQS